MNTLLKDRIMRTLGPRNSCSWTTPEYVLRLIAVAFLGVLVPLATPAFGAPPFTTSVVDIGVESRGVAVDDFNQDGFLDFVVRGLDSTLKLYLGDASGSYTEILLADDLTSGTARGADMASGDFNGDGWPDFCYTDDNDSIRVLLNNQDSTFTTNNFLGAGSKLLGIDCGDVDGNGTIDILVINSGGPVYVYSGDGNGGFALDQTIPVQDCHPLVTSLSLCAGDFNDDGLLDFVEGQEDDGDAGAAFLWAGQPDGSFVCEGLSYDTNPDVNSGGSNEVGAGYADAFDFDDDGFLDVVTPRSGYLPADIGSAVYFTGDGTGIYGSYDILVDNVVGNVFYSSAPPLTWEGCIAICVMTSAGSDSALVMSFGSDTEPPVAQCPANIEQVNDPGECGAIVTFAADFIDNCSGGSVTCTPASGSFFPVGTTIVSCTAIDGSGNEHSCMFTVTVTDTEDPVVSCPANQVVANDPGQCDAVVTFPAATATDNCPGVTVACVPPSGSVFPVGVTTVTCTATDASSNTDVCTFTVTVNDTENPVATCPSDITTDNDPGSCDAVVSFTATATDNCPGVTIACVPPSGTAFPIGATPVECIATDASGNADTCNFTVTVNDAEPPAATCPGDIAANTDPNECGAIVNYGSAVSDNCPGASITCSPASGSFFVVGTTEVECVAVDAAGKTDTCTFNVTVNDTEPPVVTCPGDTVVPADPDQCGATVSFGLATTTDNCSVASLTCTPPSGSFFPVGITTVDCVALDDAGKADTCTFTITVNDTQPPVVTCPGDTSVQAGPTGCAIVEYAPEVSDNCPGSALVCVPPSGFCFPAGETTVTCVATDAAGNADTCMFTVNVDPLCDTLRIASAGPTFVPGGWKVPVSLANCTLVGGGTVPLTYGALPVGWSCDSVCVQGTRLSDCEFFSYSIDPVQRTILVEWSCANCLSLGNGPLFIVCFSQTGGCDLTDGDIICIDTTTIDIPPTPRRLILVNCDSPAEEIPVIFEPGCFDTPTFMSGDVTCDGVCNVIDVVRLVNVAFRNKDPMVEFCPLGLPTGDLNCDGVINVLDVVLGARCAFRGDCSCICNAGSGGLAKHPVSKAVAKVETIQASTGRWTHTLSLNTQFSWSAAQFEWTFRGEAIDIRVEVGDGASGLSLFWSLAGSEMTIGLVDIYGETSIEPGERTVLHLSGTGDFPGITLTSGLLATEKAEPIVIAPVGLSRAESTLPESFQLGSNYPNPFNAGTVIPYTLARSAQVELAVYDVLGRRVRTLVDRFEAAGRHQVAWDGTGATGQELASGIYFYQLSAGDVTKSRQMVLLK